MSAWLKDAVFYQIFPDRFARSTRVAKLAGLEAWDAPPSAGGYKGGDLLGVLDRLDYLAQLGVNALYLNPIFAATANHRYHTADYFNVDPMLGGNAAFERLLGECHDRGMRVVIDGVFNHSGRGFAPFADVAENGKASPYRDWFFVQRHPINPYAARAPRYAAWMGIPALPKLNTENPEVREFLYSVAEHWVRFGIDGWRLDTPEQIETPGFWQGLADRVRQVNADAVLIGEVWTQPDEWLAPNGPFDSVLNYWVAARVLPFVGQEELDRSATRPMPYPWGSSVDGVELAAFLETLYERIDQDVQQAWLNLDASHDTPRRMTMLSGNAARSRLAEVLRFTLPGAPCIYYGEELELLGTKDPGCRAGFPESSVDQDAESLVLVRRLASLRQRFVCLRRGRFRSVCQHPTVLAFVREYEGTRVLAAINVAPAPRTLDLPETASSAEPLLGEGELVLSPTTRITLPPLSASLWALG
jgi:glycosidase